MGDREIAVGGIQLCWDEARREGRVSECTENGEAVVARENGHNVNIKGYYAVVLCAMRKREIERER